MRTKSERRGKGKAPSRIHLHHKESEPLAGYKESAMLHIQEVKGNGKLNELYPLNRLPEVSPKRAARETVGKN